MNLKFLEDIYKTFTEMRSGIYFLAYLGGLHAVSFAVYLAYKYINDRDDDDKIYDDKEDKQIGEEPIGEEQIEDKGIDDENILDELQMVPIDSINNESEVENENEKKKENKEELYLLLTTKRDELENLINQLNTVQNNIISIRDKLEELSNTSK